MKANEMWKLFSKAKNVNASYEAWAFGADSDTLAALVKAGIKTGTSSAFALYEAEDEPLPREGEYSVILDSQENAVCIIRNRRVSVLPYREVTQQHAWQEGEGNRTLDYWRSVHEPFFRDCLEGAGLRFSQDMLVVFEEFEKVYP